MKGPFSSVLLIFQEHKGTDSMKEEFVRQTGWGEGEVQGKNSKEDPEQPSPSPRLAHKSSTIGKLGEKEPGCLGTSQRTAICADEQGRHMRRQQKEFWTVMVTRPIHKYASHLSST